MLMCIFGRRRMGKTELSKTISYQAAQDGLVFVFDPVGQWPIEYATSVEQLNHMQQIPRLVSFREDEAADVATVGLMARDCVVVVDEIDMLCDSHGWKSDEARDICLRGRHRGLIPGKGGVALIINGQRPVNCHSDIKALVDKVAVFHTDYPRDLEIFGEWLGWEYVEAIKTLKPYEFVLYPDALICKMGSNGAPPEERPMRASAKV